MKISKQARRDAKQLFNVCKVSGVMDENRVRQTVGVVIEKKPRGYVGILSHFQRLVKLDIERRSAHVESAVAASEVLQQSVKANLAQRYGQGLNVTFAVNPSLIGGLRVKVGYFSQYRTEMLQAHRSVLEEASDTPARVTELYIRSLLGCFLFRDDDVFKKVSVLSGGEKTRLALVKLLLDPPNMLLMDEPTTHLDIASIDALVAALSEFIGTLVFISHDVYFIRSIATKVLHINAGVLTPYAGDYDYYLEKTKALSARVALTSATPGKGLSNGRPETKGGRSEARPNPQASGKDRRQEGSDARKALSVQKQKVSQLETMVAALEGKQNDLANELEKPTTYTTPGRALTLNQEIRAVSHDLARTTADWELAATRLAQLEAEI